MSEATHLVLGDVNEFLATYPSYTRKHRQYTVHIQVGRVGVDRGSLFTGVLCSGFGNVYV